ncbi:Heat shock protein DnaJ domain protein [Desulfosarcina cetonica]|uniref:DnaJ domain-containing protein n=1 Tax=Desulfosarcina cetonica TaxID=90730 RepID=UPI0006D10589|nr:DnaJ domain-containing protein [Desulfosarcina cetonica]VTR64469.1 Heat shock protein DnaJ domain protein [Desulfosarcina cetonica]
MSQQDYYQILGIDRNADAKKIKDAYRELAFKYHPDRNEKDPSSAEMMKKINEAYAVLSNAEKRRDYDTLRHQYGENAYGRFRSTYTEQDIFKGSDIQHIFEEMARSFGLRGVDSIFSDFYGPGYRQFTVKDQGLTGRGFLYRGRFGKRHGKPMAGGVPPRLGRFASYLFQKATGVGLPQTGDPIYDTIHMAPEFAKSGGPFPYFHRQRSKKLVVTIPAGTRDGQQIRLARMGVEGKHGGEDGDLYLKVKFKKPLLEKAKDFIVSTFRR